ncbi:hypothetical protein [Aeromonas caviae]|uniref:hypothetical protein n=1 Tax=Aeromonas caviae TaxID=648 RepID=UPI003014551C
MTSETNKTNKTNKTLSPATITSLLPQYRLSSEMMTRFIDAIHHDEPVIERSSNVKGTKFIDNSEWSTDALSYFINNKDSLRKEFTSELLRKIDKAEIDLFCEVVAKEWFDGAKERNTGRPNNLKSSVYSYLSMIYGEKYASSCIQKINLPNNAKPLISNDAIASILTVNDQMLYKHIEEWKSRHPNSDKISDDDIFLRRGVSLTSPINTNKKYIEYDFISSYSLAISAPEKFSQNVKNCKPAIINGELSLFKGRVLFFSPFILDMDVLQLELGVIPSEKPINIHFQGEHSGILEYILDPAPHQI